MESLWWYVGMETNAWNALAHWYGNDTLEDVPFPWGWSTLMEGSPSRWMQAVYTGTRVIQIQIGCGSGSSMRLGVVSKYFEWKKSKHLSLTDCTE